MLCPICYQNIYIEAEETGPAQVIPMDPDPSSADNKQLESFLTSILLELIDQVALKPDQLSQSSIEVILCQHWTQHWRDRMANSSKTGWVVICNQHPWNLEEHKILGKDQLRKKVSNNSRETELQDSLTPVELIRTKWEPLRKQCTLWLPLKSLPPSHRWETTSRTIRSWWQQWTNKTKLISRQLRKQKQLKRNGKNNISQLKQSPKQIGKHLKTNKPISMPRLLHCRQMLLRFRQTSTQRPPREFRIKLNSRLNGTESSPSKPNLIRIGLMSTRTPKNYSPLMMSWTKLKFNSALKTPKQTTATEMHLY